MRTLYFRVIVRDKYGKLYKDKEDNNVTSVCEIEASDYGEELTQLACEGLVKKFEAICKEGSQINIEISYFDKIAGSYPFLYSYYGAEKRFVKHSL